MPSKPPEDRPKLPTAKWGAACAACATAKAKCIRSSDKFGAKCDRCERLLKECTDQIHRPRKKRQPKPSRTAQIEERLNGLVSLLQASGELPNSQNSHTTPGSGDSNMHEASEHGTPSSPTESSSMPPPPPANASTTNSASGSKTWSIPATYNEFAQPNCICRPDPGPAPPPPDTDEVLLDIFRSQLQPIYPFVIIPTHVTAAKLASSRPFLMSAIRMVSSFRSLRSMRAQMYQLKKHLADYMLIRSERSLDLLFGIIVICGWYQYHCFAHGQFHNLISLAISLAGEMGLNRHPLIHEGTRMMAAQPPVPNVRSNEERRAFLGVWFLASSNSTVFGRLEPMRYTSYVQECVKALESGKEYDSDTVLVFLIKIQHLIQRVAELNPTDTTIEEFSSIPKAPASAYVSAYQHELDRILEELPPHLKEDKSILIYINTARLRLYEPPVVDKALVQSLAEAFTSKAHGAGTPLDRFYNTSNALKSWFDNWLGLPVSAYYCQTAAVAAQIVYALTMLGRWAQLSAPRPSTAPPELRTQDNTPETQGLYSFELNRRNTNGSVKSPGDKIHSTREAFQSGQSLPPCQVDPDLTAAVASLQSHLHSHPDLMIDIPDILSSICNRFEQANATFQISSADGVSGKADYNVWSMTALKVRITRARLEKWAELVSKEGENHSPGQQLKADMDTSMGDWNMNFPGNSGAMPNGSWDSNMPTSMAPDQMQMQNNYGSTPWTSDLLTGVDPTVWFDGYLDWNTIIMNSMGTVGQ